MGEERFERYLHSFEEETPVSIRLNPMKLSEGKYQMEDAVPWCRNAYYLAKRPNFTFDPLFHAGCYYVQEAASMFLDEVLKTLLRPLPEMKGSNYAQEQILSTPVPCREGLGVSLDLCAAPGGKSTLLRSALPADCVLYSNEPMQKRASILLENVTKWGYKNHHVTNLYPRDYRKSKMKFDLILCDVPCSGEGMFRKDEATIKEWSPQNVEKCWQLQREIVSDAWACLNNGGILIYSTCTFNTKENEENVRWILSEFDAEVVPIETKPEWNITGSLLQDFDEPVYRFIPGITRSEGLFMCVLRKGGERSKRDDVRGKMDRLRTMTSDFNLQPSAVKVELSYPQALAYLRREALTLPSDTPLGIVEVCFMGHPLGLMKNIGNRANNLYPKEWRIKTTHVPQEYEPVLW
ncbi:16S rRNA C967 or C1407 C5-methylase, RsmB/RsmF family [Prevotella communis]|uniref:16S rRNA C967 or C1407 C5-methylase, RsmB/RsmF family n=2 Tax=Prevotella communis TaxID=2913614 RepID=A0A1H0DXC2_9BACT|nr:16S rRNA C967 or C1407 C5-methylase, RsmB/RsmF family [Prevotella communis]SDN74661.1 16S rRNA C967 or C1407 C5-methylase, RsmB/RsmF family [Prevotella communis]